MQISYALNAFYDIFSESFYDAILKEQQVILAMETGAQPLQLLYKQAKKQKQYTKQELGNIENALINIEPFIEYKKSEFLK